MSITQEPNPYTLFKKWYDEALNCESIEEPTAMTLATADASGVPSARIVLLKDYDERGFVFYTNLASRKALELAANPRAALCFHWMPLEKQIRVAGEVSPVTAEEADAYFASRPRQSQIGAWASKQSQPLEGRFALERRIARYSLKFGVGAVPRPEFWSGFRVTPQRIEFWLKQPFRLHDRLVYEREGESWRSHRVFP